jgi:hypothetical protein
VFLSRPFLPVELRFHTVTTITVSASFALAKNAFRLPPFSRQIFPCLPPYASCLLCVSSQTTSAFRLVPYALITAPGSPKSDPNKSGCESSPADRSDKPPSPKNEAGLRLTARDAHNGCPFRLR